MKLSIKGMALAGCILWGVSFLFVALGHLATGGYGFYFLQIFGSLYPGYYAVATIGNVLIGTFWALVDGALAGAIFGWLYNMFAN
jgi:hypothetical protein